MPDLPKKPSRDVKRITISLGLVALQRLADPKVRAQVAEQGRALSGSVRSWRAERADRKADAGFDGRGTITERFGRAKLERRVARLRSSVLALGEGRPELAASLDPVLASLEELTDAMDVASTMSLPRRMRAHQRIDGVLTSLESALFEAALPQVPPRPQDRPQP